MTMSRKQGKEGHLHAVCEGTRSDFGCVDGPHYHYDRTGFCSTPLNYSNHILCHGVFTGGGGKTMNCVCDCHGQNTRTTSPSTTSRRRKVRRMRDTYDPPTLLDRLRGA